jgi:cAMP phosphodiesterase
LNPHENAMKVRVLGCSGAIAKDCRTTSFLIDGDVLIDAGTGVGDLTLEEMQGVHHVFLTHSHLDHVAALPLMVDAVANQRSASLQVHALPGTIAALRAHVFNNVIWPDFSRIPTPDAPFVSFHPLEVGQTEVNPSKCCRLSIRCQRWATRSRPAGQAAGSSAVTPNATPRSGGV